MIRVIRSISRFLAKKIIRWGIIPLMLLTFWVIGSAFLNPNSNFTFLSYPDANLAKNIKKDPLLRGAKITGEFRAIENYLGIASLSLKNPKGVGFEDEDVLTFRIKEKGSKSWHQENTYRSGLFYGYKSFPFGFPPIDGSQNKTYVFELESLNGNKNNAVSVDKDSPIFISSYKISSKEILSSTKGLLIFIYKKVISSFSSIDFLLYSTLYLTPLLYYILWHIIIKKIIFNRYFLNTVSISIIFSDILIIKGDYTGVVLCSIGFWLTFLVLNNFKTNISFIFSFVLIVVGAIAIFINPNFTATKLANWGYYMFIMGILFEMWMLKVIYLKKIVKKIVRFFY
jgi:hypothetical protein